MIGQTHYPSDVRVRRAADALCEAGYDVDLVCLRGTANGEPGTELISGVHVIRLPLDRRRAGRLRYLEEYTAFFMMASAVVSWLAFTRRYDLVYVHTLPDVLVFCSTVPRIMGARVLLDMHDPMPEMLQSKYGLTPDHPAIRFATALEALSIRYADQTVTVHEPLRQVFVERGTPAGKMAVVMNLVDQATFPRRARLPSPSRGRFVVIYAGLIAQRYGLDLAIRAVAILRPHIPELVLRIVGEGDYLPELHQLTTELNVEAHVEFIPSIPHAQVRELLEDADLGISPHRPDSLFRLSLSNKVYEYVVVGLPAIVPRTETLQVYYPDDVVRFFEPGDAVDLACAILDLYRSPQERQARVQAGWRLIEHWNWAQERTRLIALVDKLVSKPCRARVADEQDQRAIEAVSERVT
jgi:glycosyltransferase involved in cell wall biosynthesis